MLKDGEECIHKDKMYHKYMLAMAVYSSLSTGHHATFTRLAHLV